MWRIYIRQHPTLGPWVQRVEQQPSWVTRLALTAAVIVVVVPLVMLAVAAIAVGFVVFLMLALIASVMGAIVTVRQRLASWLGGTSGGGASGGGASGGGGEGRQNVRVIDRQ
jgi:uncharacterized membrane protein YgcG